MLLIGSSAAKVAYPEFRRAKDVDMLATPDELSAWVLRNKEFIINYKLKDDRKLLVKTESQNFEFEIVRPGSSSEMFMRLNQNHPHVSIAKPTTLWLIKKSHIHHPIHWRKSIEDYHFFKGKNLQPSNEEWAAYEKRKQEIDERLGQRKINLNMKNEEFFQKSAKAVQRRFDHDDLHKATCYYSKPLYDTLKKDQSKALIDRELFDALSHQDKLRTVREECYAIALERVVIPAMDKGETFDPQEAFMHALQRISTTLTKGWFREFSLEHYPELKVIDRDYVGYFLDAVSDGKIRRVC
jgi:hypothetical protein